MRCRAWFSLVIALLALILSGCTTSNQVRTKQELRAQQRQGPVRALTTDSVTYTFETFTFSDSFITGKGTRWTRDSLVPFDGTVPFSSIAFMEAKGSSTWKGLVVIPMVAAAVGGIVTMIHEPSLFDIHEKTSSCPMVYSWNGTDFRLDAEVFGTSVSKALESRTCSVLPSLAAAHGELRVRISNERPETHMLNHVELLAGDAGDAPEVALDITDRLWPVRNPEPPVSAQNETGADIRETVSGRDGRFWVSDLRNTSPGSGFRDTIEAAFDVPEGASGVTLVVDAINTELITSVYRSAGRLLGDAALSFYATMENDAELQHSLREWIRDCGLTIEIEMNDGWREAGVMLPEANGVEFRRAVRIGFLPAGISQLRVRLSTLTDVWNIDALAADFSPAEPLGLTRLPMLGARMRNGDDRTTAVVAGDTCYTLLLPPDYIDLRFDAAQIHHMRKPIYVIAAQGYLYEWFPAVEQASGMELMTPKQRIGMLKGLIRARDIFLPPLYAEWKRNPRK